MSREIETDGFITRQEDLMISKMISKKQDAMWDSLANRLDKLIPPPPFGAVYITEQGLVLMCKGTYKMLTEGKEQNYEEVRDLR